MPGGAPDATIVDDSRPALLDLTESQDGGAGADSGNTAVVMTQKVTTESEPEKQAKSDSTEPETPGAMAAAAPDNQQSVDKVTQESAAQTREPAAESPAKSEEVASVAPVQPTSGTGAGWVVRVGTFSKSANVESVASLLTNSGFKPKTTPVATSLGNSTRVWLGPYAKRETADKISDRLKTLTGEKGYVTRTSS